MKTMVVISHPTVQTSSTQQFFLATLKGEEAVTVRHLDEVWSEKKPHFTRTTEEKSLGRLRGPNVLFFNSRCIGIKRLLS